MGLRAFLYLTLRTPDVITASLLLLHQLARSLRAQRAQLAPLLQVGVTAQQAAVLLVVVQLGGAAAVVQIGVYQPAGYVGTLLQGTAPAQLRVEGAVLVVARDAVTHQGVQLGRAVGLVQEGVALPQGDILPGLRHGGRRGGGDGGCRSGRRGGCRSGGVGGRRDAGPS